MNEITQLLLSFISAYGFITMITQYDGVFGVFKKLREIFFIFRCGVCLSPWVGLLFIPNLSLLEYTALVGALVIAENRL